MSDVKNRLVCLLGDIRLDTWKATPHLPDMLKEQAAVDKHREETPTQEPKSSMIAPINIDSIVAGQQEITLLWEQSSDSTLSSIHHQNTNQ